jgi:hypothetical protein
MNHGLTSEVKRTSPRCVDRSATPPAPATVRNDPWNRETALRVTSFLEQTPALQQASPDVPRQAGQARRTQLCQIRVHIMLAPTYAIRSCCSLPMRASISAVRDFDGCGLIGWRQGQNGRSPDQIQQIEMMMNGDRVDSVAARADRYVDRIGPEKALKRGNQLIGARLGEDTAFAVVETGDGRPRRFIGDVVHKAECGEVITVDDDPENQHEEHRCYDSEFYRAGAGDLGSRPFEKISDAVAHGRLGSHVASAGIPQRAAVARNSISPMPSPRLVITD